MSKPARGTKRVCPSCGARFYDLNRSPITCPVCQAVYQVTAPASRRGERAQPVEVRKVEEPQAEAPVAESAEVISLEEVEEAGTEAAIEDEEIVDLGDEKSRSAFAKLWPHAKFPLLQDTVRDRLVPESAVIIDYLDAHYPGQVRFIPEDSDLARQVRLTDRFYDCYVHEPMQKIVTDRIRPAGSHDPYGVAQARETIAVSYPMIEDEMRDLIALARARLQRSGDSSRAPAE